MLAAILRRAENRPCSWSRASSTLCIALAPRTPLGEQTVNNWKERWNKRRRFDKTTIEKRATWVEWYWIQEVVTAKRFACFMKRFARSLEKIQFADSIEDFSGWISWVSWYLSLSWESVSMPMTSAGGSAVKELEVFFNDLSFSKFVINSI